MRHEVQYDALQDYAVCPQRYAYRWLYKAEGRANPYRVAVRRALLSVARNWMEPGLLPSSRALLIWKTCAAAAGLDKQPKLDVRGRAAVLGFHLWLQDYGVGGVGVPGRIPIELTPQRVLEVHLNTDLLVQRKMKTFRVTLEPGGLSGALAAWDELPWLAYDAEKAKVYPVVPWDRQVARDTLLQLFRGLSRKIIWPYRDERCQGCPYVEPCQPTDVQVYRLETESKRARVRRRVERTTRG